MPHRESGTQSKKIVEILRRRRRDRRWTQEKLARLIGVPRSTLSDWERGKREPQLSKAIAWFQALDYDLFPREYLAWPV